MANIIIKPSQQSVRIWMNERRQSPNPPPTPERVRQELGWELLPNNPKPRG